MTPNLYRINIVLLVVKSDFVTNNVKLCCDSTRKVLKSDLNLCISLSRPAWDAWIEISSNCSYQWNCTSRVPHGTRGLKLAAFDATVDITWSRPAWDAWIEILNSIVSAM